MKRLAAFLLAGLAITVAVTTATAILAVDLEYEANRTTTISLDLPRRTPDGIACRWTAEVVRRSWGWTERSVFQSPHEPPPVTEPYVCAEFIEAGWPVRCASGERWTIETPAGGRTRQVLRWSTAFRLPWQTAPVVVPYRPRGTGLVIDTLLFAAIAWLLGRSIVSVRRHVRRRRGRCPGCGYPVGESSVCTECGMAVA